MRNVRKERIISSIFEELEHAVVFGGRLLLGKRRGALMPFRVL